jgi:hypothetical protein
LNWSILKQIWQQSLKALKSTACGASCKVGYHIAHCDEALTIGDDLIIGILCRRRFRVCLVIITWSL